MRISCVTVRVRISCVRECGCVLGGGWSQAGGGVMMRRWAVPVSEPVLLPATRAGAAERQRVPGGLEPGALREARAERRPSTAPGNDRPLGARHLAVATAPGGTLKASDH